MNALLTTRRFHAAMTLESPWKVQKGAQVKEGALDLLRLAGFNITDEKTEDLVDELYDTKDRSLFYMGVGLRVRRDNSGRSYLLTKPCGITEHGSREWDEHRSPISDQLPPEAVEAGLEKFLVDHLPIVTGRLRKLLRISCSRATYTLRRGREHFRLFVDHVVFERLNGMKRRPQVELGLEAMSPEARAGLDALKRQLLAPLKHLGLGFSFSPCSKAMRAVIQLGLMEKGTGRLLVNVLSGKRFDVILALATFALGLLGQKLLDGHPPTPPSPPGVQSTAEPPMPRGEEGGRNASGSQEPRARPASPSRPRDTKRINDSMIPTSVSPPTR